MSFRASFFKTILMLLLVLLLCVAGLFWFDFLGVIQLKTVFAPVYRILGFAPQTSVTSVQNAPIVADWEEDRFAKRLEALELEKQALDKRDEEISLKEAQFQQIAQELEDRKLSQDEREASFNLAQEQYANRDANVAQNVKNLTGMAPQNAVAILVAMDDQDVIDILRKTEEIATQTGTSSMVAYWLSLMPAERAAVIQRKMANAVGE